jgi:DNA-binding MarR family transcriptional regulator
MTPQNKDTLLQDHRAAAASPVEKAGHVIDHLVDALAGDPSAPLRRAIILVDIALNPGTSVTALADRTDSDKSTIARDIDWLYNYGCIRRDQSPDSGREVALTIVGFAQKHLGFAARLMNDDLKTLQKFIQGYIDLFQGYRGTLRDAKIVTVMTAKGDATRAEVFDELYNGPSSTDTRALLVLIENGFLSSEDGTE